MSGHMMLLATRGSGWGGAAVGIAAAVIFVLFSAWIVLQRVRANRKDHHGS